MKTIIPYEKDIKFDTKIAEITSISLEHNEETRGEEISGDVIVSGNYKVHQISVNKEDFSYKIPFTIELTDNIDKDSIKIDINDFTYDIKDNNILVVKIELSFDYEEIVKEEIDDIEERTTEEKLDEEIANLISEDDNEEEQVVQKEEVNEIIDSNNENTYVLYHVYIVNENDTLDSICQKYSVSKECLHTFNNFEELKVGDKLLIPLEDE